MKIWLAYICLMLFSLQVLPVMEIGSSLLKGQITAAEVCNDGDASDDSPSKLKKQRGEAYHVDDPAQLGTRTELLTLQAGIAIEMASRLPKDYTGDILTPPPEVC